MMLEMLSFAFRTSERTETEQAYSSEGFFHPYYLKEAIKSCLA